MDIHGLVIVIFWLNTTYLVGVFKNDGKGRAVRYIRVINASNIVINVVKISVIPKKTPWRKCRNFFGFYIYKYILLTEKGSFTGGRNIRDDHCEEDHHRHHRCDPHCYLY